MSTCTFSDYHIYLYLQKCQLLSWKVMTVEWPVCYIRLMRVPGMSPNTWSLVGLTSQSRCGISMMGASYTHSLFMEVKWVSYWYHQITVMWVFIPTLIKWYFEVKEDFYELYDRVQLWLKTSFMSVRCAILVWQKDLLLPNSKVFVVEQKVQQNHKIEVLGTWHMEVQTGALWYEILASKGQWLTCLLQVRILRILSSFALLSAQS